MTYCSSTSDILRTNDESTQAKSSLLRYLFPRIHPKARARLDDFRYSHLPLFRQRTSSRIYRYLHARKTRKEQFPGFFAHLKHQFASRQKPHTGILARLSAQSTAFWRKRLGEDGALLPAAKMTSAGGWGGNGQDSGGSDSGAREPGTRRRKLAGYLKAANELRQTYQQSYAPFAGTSRDGADDSSSMPGAFPDITVATAQAGEQEMIIFPSYARRHVKQKPSAVPGTIQEGAGSGRDVRDSAGAGDAEFWKQQWDRYEDDNAVVDVDVRGWIYTPHKGALTRRNRLFIGLARQMVGLPAPLQSPSVSQTSSRATSPHGIRQRVEASNAKREEEMVAKEAESLTRKGEAEADAAGKGAYSEMPGEDSDQASALSRQQSREESPGPQFDDPRIKPLQQRVSWTTPGQMSATELATANAHLMMRLKPFLANPLATIPISAFFYNEDQSRQKTIYTDTSGHFTLRAALDFVPTHVRILAAEGLSATEPIEITEPKGVSIISDIDDTIKHSAIGSGAREIFRNVFIRELGDLGIDGVKDWYQRLSGMGVNFHYVSNSPWQLYPVLTGFFSLAGLPPGSFHLKQYSGMFQGIFEPVAERKKGTLEKIMRDFPERRFILVGDSGEADLEVYTDLVYENPGRILGVFIRDVTTPPGTKAFFESSEAANGELHRQNQRNMEAGVNGLKAASDSTHSEEDVDNKAGIAVSDKDLEVQDPSRIERKPVLPPRRKTEPLKEEVNLIDLDSEPEEQPEESKPRPKSAHLAPPARPPKPRRLSSAKIGDNSKSNESNKETESSDPPTTGAPASSVPPQSNIRKPAPPIPRKKPSVANGASSTPSPAPSTAVHTNPNPIRKKKPPPIPTRLSYRESAKQRLGAAYERLPSPGAYFRASSPQADPRHIAMTNNAADQLDATADSDRDIDKLPPLPKRRGTSSSTASQQQQQQQPSYASSAVNYASSLYTSARVSTSTETLPMPQVPPSSGPGAGVAAGAKLSATTNASSYAYSNQPVNKKVELWRRRWARAQMVLEDDNVVLRSWRVGGDVEAAVVRLVEKALGEEGSGGLDRGRNR